MNQDRMGLCITAILMVMFLIEVHATPPPGTLTREILIGANEKFYFSYILERKLPGSYYEFTDFFYLCKFNIGSGTLAEKQLISRTIYTTDENNYWMLDNWVRKDEVKKPINVGRYLADQRVELAFPTERSEYGQLTVEENGVFLKRGHKCRQIVSSEVLHQALASSDGEIDGEIAIIDQFETAQSYFLLIASASEAINYSHRIVSVSKEVLWQTIDELRAQE